MAKSLSAARTMQGSGSCGSYSHPPHQATIGQPMPLFPPAHDVLSHAPAHQVGCKQALEAVWYRAELVSMFCFYMHLSVIHLPTFYGRTMMTQMLMRCSGLGPQGIFNLNHCSKTIASYSERLQVSVSQPAMTDMPEALIGCAGAWQGCS